MGYYYNSGFMVNHMTNREFEIRRCRNLLSRTRQARASFAVYDKPFQDYYDKEIDRLEAELEKLQNKT